MVTFKLTDAERALLRKRTQKHEMSEADYFRMAMVFEAISAGDLTAWKMLGTDLRRKIAEGVSRAMLTDAPVKA
jgi:hypothetical protein